LPMILLKSKPVWFVRKSDILSSPSSSFSRRAARKDGVEAR